ncbi:MAG: hypothetical protein QF903_13150 [Planctomycetota bacterium]|nr:hypothetical protein [Planctomycetota bacterium]MDP6764252.1 hypothetical protein [Planctomycetota bacterium]MDP6990410.1 hypothetical protein [Planctomycetota bacterium]
MKQIPSIAAAALCLLVVSPFGRSPVPDGPLAAFQLTSPQDGADVAGGSVVEWTISARVSPEDNFGLASFAVDLRQDAGNPVSFDLPAGEAAPSGMNEFDRPAGFTNPSADPWGSGYGGTPCGPAGQRDLAQIGGAQNTFGRVGPCVGPDEDICQGQDPSLALGIGHAPQGELLARGQLKIPQASGEYTFRIAGARATCLVEANPTPLWSRVAWARVRLDQPSITVTVP